MRFEGKTVIVTGAGSGIGQAVTQQLLEEGATVYGLDIRVDGVPDGAGRLETNIADETAVRRAVAKVIADTGQVDVLCNLAGIAVEGDPVDTSLDDWERSFAVNVRGVFLATQAVLPHMIERRVGSIVNAGSTAAQIGIPNRTAYCASKGAVEAFTRQVAVEYAGVGVRCNAVSPGPVDSPMVQAIYARSADPEAARVKNAARVPVGRLARPEEIAGAILYLASDEAGFVTGAALSIDGGLVAG